MPFRIYLSRIYLSRIYLSHIYLSRIYFYLYRTEQCSVLHSSLAVCHCLVYPINSIYSNRSSYNEALFNISSVYDGSLSLHCNLDSYFLSAFVISTAILFCMGFCDVIDKPITQYQLSQTISCAWCYPCSKTDRQTITEATYPVSGAEVDSLGEVVALVEASVVCTRKCDDELASMLVCPHNL